MGTESRELGVGTGRDTGIQSACRTGVKGVFTLDINKGRKIEMDTYSKHTPLLTLQTPETREQKWSKRNVQAEIQEPGIWGTS